MKKETLPDDYEACGDCDFDHSYDYELAYAWHKANPCSYCNYNKTTKQHESDCCTLHVLDSFGNRIPSHPKTV